MTNYEQFQSQERPDGAQPQRRRALRPILWVLLGTLIGIVGTSIVLNGTHGVSPSTVTSSTPAVQKVTQTQVPTQAPTQAPIKNEVHGIGETITTQDNYTIVIHKVYTSQGDEFNTPSSGNQYLIVDVSVTNGTGATKLMSSNQFTLSDSTGQRIDNTYVSLENIHEYTGGTLQNGSTLRGQLVYNVPKGNHPYEIAFASNVIYSDIQVTWSIHS